MANIVFGTTAGNWNVPGNWIGGSQPGTGDTAVFTAASAACTIPAATTVTVGAVDFTGLGASSYTGTFTFAATTSVLTIGSATLGNCTFVAGMTLALTGLGTINFVATTASTTYSLTTAGLVMPNLTFSSGTTTTIQHADNCTATGATISHTSGIYSTNNVSITCGIFSSNSTTTRTISMGTSSITITLPTTSNFRFSALTITTNTAIMTFTGAGVTFGISSTTFGNFNGLSLVFSGSGQAAIGGSNGTGTNTFANITRTGTSVKTDSFLISSTNLAVTGAFTVTGNSTVNRVLVQSANNVTATPGTQVTIALGTTGTSSTNSNADFMDIAFTGTNAPATGSSLGDCQGNSGITFTTPVTRYGIVAGNLSSTASWSATSGGSGGSSVPLPQDTVILDGNSAAGTYTADMPRLGKDLTCTGFTRTLALTSTSTMLFGNLTLGSSMTVTGTQLLTVAGRNSQTITTNGVGFPASLTIAAPGGTYTLGSAFTVTGVNVQFTVSNGAFVDAGFSMALYQFTSASGFTRTLNMTGNITFADTISQNFWALASAGLTVISFPASISLVTIATVSRAFGGGGLNYSNTIFNYTVANSPGPLQINNPGGTIGTLNIGSGRVWTQQAGTTCTFGQVNATGVVNGYQYFPGVSGNYANSPDSSALQITGDITIDAELAGTQASWVALGEIVNKGIASSGGSYMLRFTGTAIQFFFGLTATATSSVATSSVSLPFTTGQIGWVRVTRQQSSGTVTFYTSTNGSSWTQLGTTGVINAGTAMYSGTGQSLAIGTGSTAAYVGNVYRIRIYADVTQTNLVFDANFATKIPTATSFTESSANAATVTINGAMAQAGDGSIVLNSSTPGTQATISKSSGVVTCDYLIMQDSKATGGASFYAGSHTNNVSDNSGWIFTALPVSSSDTFLPFFG